MKKKQHSKRSKKAQMAINALNRVFVPMNTGERVMRSNKDYNRRKGKQDLRKEIEGI